MNKETDDKVFTVGIGASAGGLAPLKSFVNSLPNDADMAFIIIQHLDPTHESMLSEILNRECKMPVRDAENNTPIEANTVYVIPPDVYLEIEDGVIVLCQPQKKRGFRKAIDHFFRSLARDCGNSCAAIVLSGSGSDGTAGLRSVRASGGLTIVQAPEEAEHHSMPQSAIDAHAADKTLSVDAMYKMLTQYAAHPVRQNTELQQSGAAKADGSSESLDDVAAILKEHEKFNLTQYKLSTIQRRIARRMSLTDKNDYSAYLQLLKDSNKERKQLTKELLINVTDFFRDPDAYKILENSIIPEILNNIKTSEDVRVWVTGCASGEEAYSLAILILEALSQRRMENGVKIFATDIDEHAIKIARRGVYPDSIATEVPATYLEKYFIKVDKDNNYRIKNHVRELVSFATHNVASDPPFNHMHLISCRNLLIYLNKDVQEKVLDSFHFALNEHNYLFLGSSESLGKRAHCYKTVHKKWRFYEKLPGANERNATLPRASRNKNTHTNGTEIPASVERKRSSVASRGESIRHAILETQVPATIVVDQHGAMLYNHGNLEPFCTIPKGEPRNDIMQMIRPSLRSRLRSAFFKVKKSQSPL